MWKCRRRGKSPSGFGRLPRRGRWFRGPCKGLFAPAINSQLFINSSGSRGLHGFCGHTSCLFSVSYRLGGDLRGSLRDFGALKSSISCIFNNSSAEKLNCLFSITHRLLTFCRFIRPFVFNNSSESTFILAFFRLRASAVDFHGQIDSLPYRLQARFFLPSNQRGARRGAAGLSAFGLCLSLVSGHRSLGSAHIGRAALSRLGVSDSPHRPSPT